MRKTLLTYFILLFSSLVWAQSGTKVETAFPYECGFEENEDLTAWYLNYGTSTATDKWMFGTAVHSDGKRSMYISAYGGEPNFGGKKNVVVSYLRYKFPTSSKTQKYNVSFDWKGRGDSTTSKLYVLFALESELWATGENNYKNLNQIISSNGILSNGTVNVCQSIGDSGEKFVCGSDAWQNVSLSNSISINSTNSNNYFAFVFIWVNGNTTDSLGITSIAIDNFQINSASINKPENLVVYPHCEDSTLILTWETSGAANEFDIQYRKVGETSWARGISGVTDGTEGFTREDGTNCTFALKRILEGSYDVRIRSGYYDSETNQTLHSQYVYQSLILVYCPDNHCVNYVNLDDPSVVCTTGFFPNYNNNNETPYDVIGKVDYGPDSQDSRHTLHVDPDEVDPRTDSLLHTVPPGALASVRLGNWNWGGEAESVTYTIHVDSVSQGILIVQYAVVFEDPGHDDEPQFELVILDQNDNIIDPTCGHAIFTYSDAVDAGWNMTLDGHVAWKDWTTVGVNLMPYHNQDIKVRFTTMDCGWGGHFGYAYFTLDCANAHIETENCGNDPYVNCIAPDGFAYEWRDETGAIFGHDQVLSVDAGMHTYTCKVSFIEQPDCFFEISTLSAPRFPVPEYSYEQVFGNCMSQIKFTNTSHVMNKFEGYEKQTSEPCNESRWQFRSLTTNQIRTSTATSPTYQCRDEGDSIEVTITSYIGADNSCDSTRVDTIVMPNIIPRDSTIRATICYEEFYRFDNQIFDKHDTVYEASYPNFAGCDSVVTLHLKVLPQPKELHIHDSICSDQYVMVNGIKYNSPLDDYLIMLNTVEHGCDSAIHLTLTVNERLQGQVHTPQFVCADESRLYLALDISAGVFDSLQIAFTTPELRDTVIYDNAIDNVLIPYPAHVLPGHYQVTLRFHQYCCGVHEETHAFDIRYAASIVEQKWNDVLTLLSPQYNGGYRFTEFQWYKNDEQIQGENHSYLYQPLDTLSEYYVLLTREDGVTVASCPIQPVYHPQQSEFPSIVKANQQLPVYMEQAAEITYYTVSGQLYTTFSLPQGYSTLYVPGDRGVYVLKSVNASGETKAHVMLVE